MKGRPRIVSLEEEECYELCLWRKENVRTEKWRAKFENQRKMFWNNTNIGVASATEAEALPRHLFTQLQLQHGQGGNFVQPCGSMGTWERWVGGISDSDYQRSSGTCEAREDFANTYKKETVAFSRC